MADEYTGPERRNGWPTHADLLREINVLGTRVDQIASVATEHEKRDHDEHEAVHKRLDELASQLAGIQRLAESQIGERERFVEAAAELKESAIRATEGHEARERQMVHAHAEREKEMRVALTAVRAALDTVSAQMQLQSQAFGQQLKQALNHKGDD